MKSARTTQSLYNVGTKEQLVELLSQGAKFKKHDTFATICAHPIWKLREDPEVVKILYKINPQLLSSYSIIDCLFKAVKENNVKHVYEFHALGVNINVFDEKNHILSLAKTEEMVNCLIECGVDIEANSPCYSIKIKPTTALVHAWSAGNIKLLVALQKHNAILIEGIDLIKSLIDAVAQNDFSSVNFLLDNHVNINTCYEPYGYYSLHAATTKEMAELLIKRGADLLALSIPDSWSKEQFFPLHVASKEGRKEVVEVFLQNNVDVNLLTPQGKTALFLSCENEHIDVVLTLLQHRAQYNENTQIWLPLFKGIKNNNFQLVNTLLDMGISIKSADPNGQQVLHIANTKEMTELLIKRGADIIAWSKEDALHSKEEKLTPFHVACKNGKEEVLVTLLEYNIDINIQTTEGKTGLDLACKQKLAKIAIILLKKGAIFNNDSALWRPLFAAVEQNDIQSVKDLLAIGVSITSIGESNTQVLHVARGKEMVNFLIQCGANKDALCQHKNYYIPHGNDEYMPIHKAIESGKSDVVEALLENGVNINSKTKSGKSVIEIILERGSFYQFQEIIKNYPIDYCQGSADTWPLDTAALSGNLALFSLMLEKGAQYAPHPQLQNYINLFATLPTENLIDIAKNYIKILSLWKKRKCLTTSINKTVHSFSATFQAKKKDSELLFDREKNKKLPNNLKNSLQILNQHCEYIQTIKNNLKNFLDEIKKENIFVLKALIYHKAKFITAHNNALMNEIEYFPLLRNIRKKSLSINNTSHQFPLRELLSNDQYRYYVGLDSDNYWFHCFAGLHSFGPIDHDPFAGHLGALGDRSKYSATPIDYLISDIQVVIKKNQKKIDSLVLKKEGYCNEIIALRQIIPNTIRALQNKAGIKTTVFKK